MLRLNADMRFTARAVINLKGLQASFEIHCRLLDTERLNALNEQQRKAEITPEQFVQAWLVGWPEGEVCNAAGEPEPFSDQAVADLLKLPGAPLALAQAFYTGYEEATEGNCAPLPAGS